jgi:hypothetical protein
MKSCVLISIGWLHDDATGPRNQLEVHWRHCTSIRYSDVHAIQLFHSIWLDCVSGFCLIGILANSSQRSFDLYHPQYGNLVDSHCD